MRPREYAVKGYAELKQPLVAVLLAALALARAQTATEAADGLVEALHALSDLRIQCFWESVFRYTPLSEQARLRLSFRDGEAVLLLLGEGEEEDDEDTRERASDNEFLN